jgi:hypothetical protein
MYRYPEAISILYTKNLFAFRGPSTFKLFCSIVPSQRLASIRKLYIELMYRDFIVRFKGKGPEESFQDEAEWIALWELVGKLKGPKPLEVKVVSTPRGDIEGGNASHLQLYNTLIRRGIGRFSQNPTGPNLEILSTS